MKILITGSEGAVGRCITPYLAKEHSVIATVYKEEFLNKYNNENIKELILDIESLENCINTIKDVDAVIHLAGIPYPDSSFDDVLNKNMIATYNVLEACHINKIKRVIYPSSAYAVEGYPIDKQVETTDNVRPKNFYGVSKCFGEAICSYYGYELGLEIIALRIAAFNKVEIANKKLSVRDLSAYLSKRDLCHLIDRCLVSKMDKPFYILNAISDNTYKRLSLENTKSIIGYKPVDNAFVECDIDLKQ